MTTLIKLFYAGAIAALWVLLVAFGIRTFYAPPSMPEPPQVQPFPRLPVAPIATPSIGPAPVATPSAEEQAYQQEQQRFQDEYERYQQRREDYHRNVFLAAAALGVVAVAGGIALARSLDAIRLGLVTGGLVTLIYSVVQAGGDLDNGGPGLIFAVAVGGLALVLVAGYRWLATSESS